MIRFHNRVIRQAPAHASGAAEVRPAPQARDAALPVADPPRLPAADLSRRVVDDVFTNGRKLVEPDAAPTDVPDDADRVLGGGVPARPQHDPPRYN
jgi:hypothetical protein